MSSAAKPTLNAARSFHARGWQPVHIAPRTKRPTQTEWPTLRPTLVDVDQWFSRDANVGVALGEPSGWLVDVDVDAADALPLAQHFLAETWVFGRPSNQRSHWLYLARDARTVQFRDDRGEMIVELRSTGCQTVMPPSTHLSGEPISWDAETADSADMPREVSAAELTDRVARLALAVMELRSGATAAQAVTAAHAAQKKVTEAPVFHRAIVPHGDVTERARRYLAKLPPAVAFAGGHAATWRAALALTRGFLLPPEDALGILVADFNPRCDPPWSERELRHKVEGAANANVPAGFLLQGRE